MKKIILLVFSVGVVNAQYIATDNEDISASYNSQVLSQAQQRSEKIVVAGASPLLFDNGPIVSSIGTGLNGEDESILQNNSLGMTTIGAGAQLAAPADNRVADDFEVTHGGWQIEEILVTAYQTGEVASTITGLTMQIWDGLPGDPGSTVVFGDTTTNQLVESWFSGTLRVTEATTGTTDNRQITNNQVNVNMFFPEGTYWVDYQFTGSGVSGPWVPTVTIVGETSTGNALQQINETSPVWNELEDDGSFTPQGLPMWIYGTQPDLIFENGFEEVVAM